MGATGNVVGLFLTQNECLYGYLETMRQCCMDFGIPQTVYSDNHTIFRSPKTGKLTVDELIAGKTVHLTQFGRSMHELGVDLIFAKTPLAKGIDLDAILCVKHTRKTDAAGTFSFKNRCFQILDKGFPIINARREITILINPRFGIRVEYGGRVYNTIRYLKPQNKNANMKVPKKVRTTVEPHLQLRHSSKEWKAIWWMEDYNLSLKFLYELFFEKQQSIS